MGVRGGLRAGCRVYYRGEREDGIVMCLISGLIRTTGATRETAECIRTNEATQLVGSVDR